MIYDEAELGRRFISGIRVAAVLDNLAEQVGAMPIADYAWEVLADGQTVRHLRRMTPIGLISVREEGAGETQSMRAQIVTLQLATDIAIVRHESADGGFWELHVGDGNPWPVPESELTSAFELVRAALEATAPA